MAGDKFVVIQVRVGAVDAVDLLTLARAQRLRRVQAPDAFQKALAPEDFVKAGDAAGIAIRGVEEGGVAISDFDGAAHQFSGHRAAAGSDASALGEKFARALRPD